ncbi:MAG TPA: hypothetical protein VGV87_06895, partial [Blastocatellia bacterium]|nr:hypothetical protein [Blastocatellia bacterium]
MHRSSLFIRLLTLVVSFAMSAPLAHGQARNAPESNLRITVTDPRGAAIVGARVSFKARSGNP